MRLIKLDGIIYKRKKKKAKGSDAHCCSLCDVVPYDYPSCPMETQCVSIDEECNNVGYFKEIEYDIQTIR